MPKNQGKRRPYKKPYKKHYKRKYPIGRTLKTSSGSPGIAEQMFVKLKYVETFSLTGAPSIQLFRGNDLFDPNYTGTGHQPYLSDQLGPLYQNFTVYASKIKISAGTDGVVDGRVLVRPTNSSATIANFDLSVERPDTKSCSFTPERRCNINHYSTSKKILGVSDIDDLEYAGRNNTTGPATSPNQIWYWAVSTIGADGSSIVAVLNISITYYVKYWKRTLQNIS